MSIRHYGNPGSDKTYLCGMVKPRLPRIMGVVPGDSRDEDCQDCVRAFTPGRAYGTEKRKS